MPTNRWSVAAGFPSSGTRTATILPGDNIVQFNTDGTLNLPQSTFATANALSITWDPSVSGGASPQNMTFNLGTNGQTNGLSQLGTTFTVGTINQDGVQFGNFTGVTIDAERYRHRELQQRLASGDLHSADRDLRQSGRAAARDRRHLPRNPRHQVRCCCAKPGPVPPARSRPSSLENSTVDIATEFSKLIITQSAYQANSKIITAAESDAPDADHHANRLMTSADNTGPKRPRSHIGRAHFR